MLSDLLAWKVQLFGRLLSLNRAALIYLWEFSLQHFDLMKGENRLCSNYFSSERHLQTV